MHFFSNRPFLYVIISFFLEQWRSTFRPCEWCTSYQNKRTALKKTLILFRNVSFFCSDFFFVNKVQSQLKFLFSNRYINLRNFRFVKFISANICRRHEKNNKFQIISDGKMQFITKISNYMTRIKFDFTSCRVLRCRFLNKNSFSSSRELVFIFLHEINFQSAIFLLLLPVEQWEYRYFKLRTAL